MTPDEFEGFFSAPVPRRNGAVWLVPIALGVLSTAALLVGFSLLRVSGAAGDISQVAQHPEPQQDNPVTDQQPPAVPAPVSPVPDLPAVQRQTFARAGAVYTPGNSARLRAKPSRNSETLAFLAHSQAVELAPGSPVRSDDGIVWLPVRVMGMDGWVASNLVRDSANGN